MTTLTGLAGAAVELASRGYHVFPCKPGQKTPLTTHGFKDATRDERKILHWWDTHPKANIGIACEASGIVVLDIDSKHGADPNTLLKDKQLQGAAIVQTGTAPEPDDAHPQSLEGRRGVQVYFRGRLRTTDTTIPGVEIRGNGAYVVAPPSLHPSGVHYGPQLPMPASTLLEVPDWVQQIIPSARTNGAAAPVTEIITAGARNTKLVSIAGTMRRRGLEAPEIAASLHSVNERRCRPPLSRDEVEAIARSVARYAPAEAINGAATLTPLPAGSEEAAAELAGILELNSVRVSITAIRVYGKGSGAGVELDLSNGERMTFGALRDMLRPQTLIAEVAACAGARPALKQPQCAEVMVLTKRLAEYIEVDSENDIAREWGRDYLQHAETIDVDMNDQSQRWAAFELLKDRHPNAHGREKGVDLASAGLVLRDIQGVRYVRTLWFEAYVKSRDSTVSRLAVGARMARVGWTRRGRHGDIKATSPGFGETRIYPFWLVPADWGVEAKAA